MSNDQIDNVARPHSPSTQVLEMTLKAELRLRRRDIIKIAQYYGAHNIRIFGSVKNEIERLDSDIDLLVDLEKGRSLLDLGGMVFDLQQLLGRKVDIVTEKGLHWYVKDKIINEAEEL